MFEEISILPARRAFSRMTYARLSPFLAPVLAAVLVLGAAPALAAPAGGGALTVELNKLEDQGKACRAYLLFENGTGHAFSSLRLDLVMFDADGVVARRLAVEGAPLAEGKTSLKVFDVQDVPCAGIGRILINDVLACADGAEKREDCLGEIRATSRAATPLIK